MTAFVNGRMSYGEKTVAAKITDLQELLQHEKIPYKSRQHCRSFGKKKQKTYKNHSNSSNIRFISKEFHS